MWLGHVVGGFQLGVAGEESPALCLFLHPPLYPQLVLALIPEIVQPGHLCSLVQLGKLAI